MFINLVLLREETDPLMHGLRVRRHMVCDAARASKILVLDAPQSR
jgi:hypothetical protein